MLIQQEVTVQLLIILSQRYISLHSLYVYLPGAFRSPVYNSVGLSKFGTGPCMPLMSHGFGRTNVVPLCQSRFPFGSITWLLLIVAGGGFTKSYCFVLCSDFRPADLTNARNENDSELFTHPTPTVSEYLWLYLCVRIYVSIMSRNLFDFFPVIHLC